MKKFLFCLLCLALSTTAHAEEWTKTRTFSNSMGSSTTLSLTYYSAQAVAAEVAAKAQKEMWTASEAENYRYNLLNELKLDEYIPVKFSVKNAGPRLHLVPFDSQIVMHIGKNAISPAEFDPKLNYAVTEGVEGLVWFPRFDSKGNPYITDKTKTVKVTLYNSVAPAVMDDTWSVVFDTSSDDPKLLEVGTAGARREIDRLLKRVEILRADKAKAEEMLNKLNSELETVNARIEELQKQ